jgi:hypothetical protein
MHFHYSVSLYQISVAFKAQKTCRVYNENGLINVIKRHFYKLALSVYTEEKQGLFRCLINKESHEAHQSIGKTLQQCMC